MRWAAALTGDRPDPDWREAAAAGGTLLAVGGALTLVAEASEFDRVAVGLASSAFLVAALLVFRLLPHRTAVTAAATSAVLASIGLAVAVLGDAPSRGRAVVAGLGVTAVLIVLFTLGRGARPVLLGATAVAVWFTALAVVIDPAVTADSTDPTSQATRAGVVSLTVVVAYLAVAWRLDLHGQARAATPLVAVGNAAAIVVALTLAPTTHPTVGGLLVAALGLALLFAGTARARRATAWLGTAGVGAGIAVVLGGNVESPAQAGVLLLVLAFAFGAAAVAAANRGVVGAGHGGIGADRARRWLGATAPVDPAEAEDFLDPVAISLGPWVVHRMAPRVPDLLGVLAGASLIGGVALLAVAAEPDGGVYAVAAGVVFVTAGALALVVAGRGPVAMAGVPLILVGVGLGLVGVAGEVVESESVGALFLAVGALLYGALYVLGPARGRPSVLTAGLGSGLLATGVAVGGALGALILLSFPGAVSAPLGIFTAFSQTVVEEQTIVVPDDLEFPSPQGPAFEFPEPGGSFTEVPFPTEFPTSVPAACPDIPPDAPPEVVEALERIRADRGCVGLAPLAADQPLAAVAQPFDPFQDVTRRSRNAAAAAAGFAIVALGLGYLADRRRLLGMATPLLGVGLYALGSAFPTLVGTTSLTWMSAAFTVLFLGVGFLGGVMGRRGTTWLSSALALTALLTCLAAATQDITASAVLALTLGVVATVAVALTAERQPRDER